jgi:tRNA-splicing ligase RtcB
MNIEVRGDVDPRAVDQLKRCAEAGDAVAAAMCADGHVGYSQPIGGVVAYKDYISPSGVGYDIGCGNKAVCTNLQYDDIKYDTSRIMDDIYSQISFGIGRRNNDRVDHSVLDAIHNAEFAPQRQLYDLAAKQLGTVGAGNHYVDLFKDSEGFVWVGVHFGSRGFGHKTASGFLALAKGLRFTDHAPEGEMDSPPVLLPVDSNLGQSYIAAMELAGRYAYAGRNIVVDKVLQILDAQPTFEVHNHHNFAWNEVHNGESVWVIRKGCTPAWTGQFGFVGATMGENSVILRGLEHSKAQKNLLYSTVHGAGRVMSRTKAAGKWRRRWTCNNRDCDWYQGPGEHKPEFCPKCGHNKFGKVLIEMKPGLIDFESVKKTLVERGIELRGGAADEAPDAYKRLPDVLAAHSDTIEVVCELEPIGIAMAGLDTLDPYKD